MMSRSEDPFTILGVRREASLEEVKHAYRRLAMYWHPDRNPSAAAAAEFGRVHAAYELFLDPQRMKEWRQSQTAETGGTPMAADTTADMVETLSLTLEEAAFGCQKPFDLVGCVLCRTCQGGGKQKHQHLVPCPSCSGCGRVISAGGRTSRCAACAGRGYMRETTCLTCAGSGTLQEKRTLVVTVPPGMFEGERLRLAHQATVSKGSTGAVGGNLYLEIVIEPHAVFSRHGRDLHCEVPVSVFRLLAGGRIEVPTLAATCAVDLPVGGWRDTDIRLSGRGFPGKNGKPPGDLVVRVQCIVPLAGSSEDAPLLEALDARLHKDLAKRAPELAAWEMNLMARSLLERRQSPVA